MTYQDNTNKGTLGLNKFKKADNHPDFSGKVNVAGAENYVSAYLNFAKASTLTEQQKQQAVEFLKKIMSQGAFFGLSFRDANAAQRPQARGGYQQTPAPAPARQEQANQGAPFNDDIPF